MLLGCSRFPFTYSDIKNNYINQLVLKQYKKVKDKCVEKDEKAYEIAIMDFRDFNCFKEIPSFDIIEHLYNDQLANKNEVQSNNEYTESIVDFTENDYKQNFNGVSTTDKKVTKNSYLYYKIKEKNSTN